MTAVAADGTIPDVVDDVGTTDPDEPGSLAALYRSERHRLLRTAALLTGDRAAAEDLVHDAFLAVQRKWGSLSDASAAAGYVRVAVLNRARSLHRRSLIAHRGLHSIEPSTPDEADVALLLAEEHRAVVLAVRALSRRQRDVIVLRYWYGMSEAEIAAALGVSAGTVKSSASRGIAALREQLGSTDE